MADSSQRPAVLLGFPFTTQTVAETLDRLERMIAERSPNLIVTANLDFVVKGMKDPVFKQIVYSASLVTPDGMPLVWAGRMLNPPIKERVAGSDSIPLLLERAAKKGHSVFLLGAKPGVADLAAERSRERWPGLKIVGTYSPPFANVWEMDNEGIVARVNKAAPDILLISLGSPKQENWMSMNLEHLNVPVIIGVGGTIDFLSGTIPRAPEWMKKLSLEWIWRLSLEPRRLAKRYAIDLRDGVLPLFMQASVDKAARFFATNGAGLNGATPRMSNLVLHSGGSDIHTILVEPDSPDQLIQYCEQLRVSPDRMMDALILDLQRLKLFDSSVVSAVVALDRTLRKSATHLVAIVGRRGHLSFHLAKVLDMLVVVSTIEKAHEHLRSTGKTTLRVSTVHSNSGATILSLRGELSTNTTCLLEPLRTILKDHKEIIVDATEIRAVDTAGLRRLVELWLASRGGDMKMVCVVGKSRWATSLETSGPKQHLVLFERIEDALRSRNSTPTASTKQPTPHNSDGEVALAR